jgi:hypothetical protein
MPKNPVETINVDICKDDLLAMYFGTPEAARAYNGTWEVSPPHSVMVYEHFQEFRALYGANRGKTAVISERAYKTLKRNGCMATMGDYGKS